MDPKLLEAIQKKVKDIDKLEELDSRHPRFKAWQASVRSILKNLPPEFNNEVNDFKRLSFEDTKYHRGKNLYDPSKKDKYIKDLESARKILAGLAAKAEENKKPADS